MTARFFEPKPIVAVCEAIAYNYPGLPDDIREQLAQPDDELVHTLFNLIELRPGHADPGVQLSLGGNR